MFFDYPPMLRLGLTVTMKEKPVADTIRTGSRRWTAAGLRLIVMRTVFEASL